MRLFSNFLCCLVAKFRRRTRYLEFLVRVVQKGFHEGHRESVLEWSEETLQWLNRSDQPLLFVQLKLTSVSCRRNDTIITPKVTSIPKGHTMALTGDPIRYTAAVVEYTKVRC